MLILLFASIMFILRLHIWALFNYLVMKRRSDLGCFFSNPKHQVFRLTNLVQELLLPDYWQNSRYAHVHNQLFVSVNLFLCHLLFSSGRESDSSFSFRLHGILTIWILIVPEPKLALNNHHEYVPDIASLFYNYSLYPRDMFLMYC